MQRFIARHPILDRFERVYGYELLFRPGGSESEFWPSLDGTPRAEEGLVRVPDLTDFEEISEGARAFIKCPREALLAGDVAGLPPGRVVIEISSLPEPDDKVIKACHDLKEAGFTLALENFPVNGENPLADVAQIIKLDVTASADRAQWLLIKKFRPKGTIFIADKVESRPQFQFATQQGYSYMQGHSFLRPQPYAPPDVSPVKLVYLLVLAAVTRPEIDLKEVAEIIKHDLALSYKLLRFLNSARFALQSQVKSIRHALLLLGQNEIRKWIGLISVAGLGEGGPPILVSMALIRAAFCEYLAPLVGEPNRQPDYFFLGLLSSIDVLMRRPMRAILAELPVADDVSSALMGEPSPMYDALRTVVSYEQGNWEECSLLAKKQKLTEEKLREFYLQALGWSRELTHAEKASRDEAKSA